MGTKTRKTEDDDQVVSDMKELYQNILNEQEALKNLLIAIEKQDAQNDRPGSEKDSSQK